MGAKPEEVLTQCTLYCKLVKIHEGTQMEISASLLSEEETFIP